MNEPLLEAALRPFSDNAEMKHAAAAFLEDQSSVDPAAAAKMVSRWDALDAAKHRFLCRWILWLAVIALAATVATRDFHEIAGNIQWLKWTIGGPFTTPMPDRSQQVAEKLTAAQRHLVVGSPEALWQSNPENPVYFADYAMSHLNDHGDLPPDFSVTAHSLDPDNGWFADSAAGVAAKDTVKAKSRKRTKVGGKLIFTTPKEWEILDQAKLDRALALFQEARTHPKWQDLNAEMLRLRIAVLPEDTFLDRMDSVSCLASTLRTFGVYSLHLGNALAAAAWQKSEAGDLAGFEILERDTDRFLHQISAGWPGTLLDELVRNATVTVIADSFSFAAASLGSPSADRWKTMAFKFEERREQKQSRKFIVDGKEADGSATSGITDSSMATLARQTATPPKLTAAELKPARLLDHDLISWILSEMLWVGIALCLGLTALFRFRVSELTRRLARRMTELLRPSDSAWIVGVGVILPFAYVMCINRFTPLGGRDLGVWATGKMLPAAHFLGLWLLWLTVPVQIVRWRMAVRARGFGFPGPSWLGWVGIACAGGFVPMCGWAIITPGTIAWRQFFELQMAEIGNLPWMGWVAVGLLGGALLAIAASIFMALLSRPERLLMPAVSARAMVPSFAAILLLLTLSSLAFKAAQQMWFERDTLGKFDRTTPAWSVFEGRIATQLHEELREIIAGETPR